jgi:trk system potassium uptake protein TrkA
MKQFAIIGLGSFGMRMLEELLTVTQEIIIIDKDREIIERYKDRAKAAYITDAINEAALKKIIPGEIDAVIVDLGGKIEVSLMTTSYLKKMGIKEIIVKAETDEHGEILELVGATKVVFPDREAAKRITPMLASTLLFNYMPISEDFALAEVHANEACVGKTLIGANMRQAYGLNVVAMRKEGSDTFLFLSDPSYVFTDEDLLLVAGTDDCIRKYSSIDGGRKKNSGGSVFRSLFSKSAK